MAFCAHSFFRVFPHVGVALSWAVMSACSASLLACSSPSEPDEGAAATDPPTSSSPGERAAPAAASDEPRDPSQLKEPVMIVERGADGEIRERYFEASVARASGYTLVSLSDDWTPYIFEEHHDSSGRLLPNRYRRVFIGLANDELDGDGLPLDEGQKNYLELYGIFPSFSVLRQRFMLDRERTCVTPESQQALAARESVRFRSPWQTKRDERSHESLGRELASEQKRAGVDSLAALIEARPKLKSKIQSHQRWLDERAAMAAAEERLACEGILDLSEPKTKQERRRAHVRGMHDEALRVALRRFQQKHMIYEGHTLRPRTLDALERSTLDNDHASLMRALRERVVSAAGILEDGSTHRKDVAPEYESASGQKLPMRNLADEFRDAAAKQLGIDTTEGALAFFERHEEADFEKLWVGVKLPQVPEYYSSHMDLSLEIDRGDVWYDPPFDDNDKWAAQPRSRFPRLTLYVNYRDQQLPLVRWRTTIGGWRSEQAENGYEYYKYKASDVGPRVMRKIISGPVWIAPESTPIRSLVTSKKIQERWQGVVNYEELGPGYESAYGLVAGYFVIPGEGDAPDVDRGIRAHGSSNYLSIYSSQGYSHGCHRLPNHLAIRLYDFLLQHRNKLVQGDAGMDFKRQFLANERVYEMRIPSRGYEFELDPPLPINVLRGRIRGEMQKAIEGYVPKPGVRYPGPPPGQEEEEAADTVTGASQAMAPAGGTP